MTPRPTTAKLNDLALAARTKLAAVVIAALALGVTLGVVPKCSDYQTTAQAAAQHLPFKQSLDRIERKLERMDRKLDRKRDR